MTHKTSLYEPAIREHLRKSAQSASHGFEHIDLVLSYALGLQAIYGGDLDVITAAALLHDLDRSNPRYRGVDSAMHSAESASAFLEAIKFLAEKIPQVLTAIAEHD